MGRIRLPSRSEPRPNRQTSGDLPYDEYQRVIEQARWLLEWHNARSQAFEARAVAMLGFSGVVLALLPSSLDWLERVPGPGSLLVGSLVFATLFATITAVLCVLVVRNRRVNAPGIEQLRLWWRDLAAGGDTRKPISAHIAESLLHGRSPVADSPVDLAYREADQRGRLFRLASVSLLCSVVALAAFLSQLTLSIGGD